MAYMEEPMVAQVQEFPVVSASLSPVDKQDPPQVELEATLYSGHPAPAPFMELETSGLPT